MLDLNLQHDEDQDEHHHIFSSPNLQSPSSSSSLSTHIFLVTPSQHQPLMVSHQQEACKFESGCNHNHSIAQVDEGVQSGNGLKFKIKRKEADSIEYETEHNNSSAKWMSSKMRMMRKMISSDRSTVVDPPTPKFDDHHHHDNKLHHPSPPLETDNSSNSSSNNSVRVCADCHTTKTPLWRSGPRGPKSLCNACGIRQRKARRAMAAAAAAANGTALPVSNKNPPPMKKVQHKNKRSPPSHNNGVQASPLKKRCKMASPSSSASSRKKICFEDLRISLSKSSAFQQVFPQDEKEAAILLMALSYGLVHG